MNLGKHAKIQRLRFQNAIYILEHHNSHYLDDKIFDLFG